MLENIVQHWRTIKYPLGIFLFISVTTYGMSHAPHEILNISPSWLIASLGSLLLMFAVQQWQVHIFLKTKSVTPGLLYPALFTARKGMLNTILPAKTGTILLLHTLCDNYDVKWHDFLVFSVVASAVSIYISAQFLIFLIFPTLNGLISTTIVISASIYISTKHKYKLARHLPELLINSLFMFITISFTYYCILRGMGFELSRIQATYFAVILNTLAQVAITPGNIGIRETILGLTAPYLSLPISVGIISGAVLLTLRLAIYSLIWAIIEWLYKRKAKNTRAT